MHFIWYMLAVHAREARILAHAPQLGEDRFRRPRLDDPSLVSGDRAERAAPEAPSHDRHRILDDLESRDLLPFVHRVRLARVGEAVDPIHIVLSNRQRRRVADDRLAVVVLHQALGVERVRLLMNDLGRPGEQLLIGFDFLEGREHDCVGRRRLRLAGAQGVGHAAHRSQILDGLAGG
jgi:hypothetical protein